MNHSLQILESNDPHADQISVTGALLDAIGELEGKDRATVAATIRSDHSWSAPLLRFATALNAQHSDTLQRLRVELEASEWIEETATSLGRFTSVGVLSMGRGTTAVLSQADQLGRLPAQGFVSKRGVGQALSFLDLQLIIHPPEQATVLLLPGVCAIGTEIYGTSAHIETANQALLNGAVVIAVVHPVAKLDPTIAAGYTPAEGFSAIRL